MYSEKFYFCRAFVVRVWI